MYSFQPEITYQSMSGWRQAGSIDCWRPELSDVPFFRQKQQKDIVRLDQRLDIPYSLPTPSPFFVGVMEKHDFNQNVLSVSPIATM